jgi:predicted nucleotidyltransferase
MLFMMRRSWDLLRHKRELALKLTHVLERCGVVDTVVHGGVTRGMLRKIAMLMCPC